MIHLHFIERITKQTWKNSGSSLDHYCYEILCLDRSPYILSSLLFFGIPFVKSVIPSSSIFFIDSELNPDTLVLTSSLLPTVSVVTPSQLSASLNRDSYPPPPVPTSLSILFGIVFRCQRPTHFPYITNSFVISFQSSFLSKPPVFYDLNSIIVSRVHKSNSSVSLETLTSNPYFNINLYICIQ